MATLKQKGDLAELKVATDLVAQGFRILFPFGEDHLFDLALTDTTGRKIERVQVKHARSDGQVLYVKCFTHSLTNGRVRSTTRYTANDIEWLAVWDAATDRCFYLPAVVLGAGRAALHLRYTPTRNNQTRRVRWADDYRDLATARATTGLSLVAEGP